jgi:hypothetical protein
LKRNKCCDLNNNVADFFIDANDFISPYLCIIYNKIYNTGEYPSDWCKGYIVPIHKKGPTNDPSNYRGITIINVISKIFSLLLRNRLNKWCEHENVFCENQFGFRDNRSTSDAIFLLHTIIQKVLHAKSKLWCVFIDYQKAFDTVIHDALWVKLVESGVSSKLVTMVKSIYANVSSCVKISADMSMTDFFNVSLGVKQGEPLSPLLFILFINDVVKSVDFNNLTDNDLNLLSMYIMLFADDIVLFTTDPVSLQAQVDSLYQYSCKWGLTINMAKTKLYVFEKRKSRNLPYIFINGEQIERVDEFTYLGITFTYTGTLLKAVKTLSEQALRAYHSLLNIFDRVKLDVKTKLHMFDSMVVPILLYGSEVWGAYDYKEIDKLHIRFCKYILGVRKQTPNVAVYGELGRFLLSVLSKIRSLNYLLKIKKNIVSPIYGMFNDLERRNIVNSWASCMNISFDKLGFTYILNDFNPNVNYIPILKRRIYDQYIQDWSASINTMSKLEYYRKYKTTFKYEKYLDLVSDDKLRKSLSCFRLCSHSLEIELGRYAGVNREARHCKICNNRSVESEYHFLLCCNKYTDIRNNYLGHVP